MSNMIVDFVKHHGGPTANIDITEAAITFRWIVFVIMALSGLGIYALSLTRKLNERAFHELAAAVCITAAISYFAMAADYGAVPVEVEYIRKGVLGKDWIKAGILHPTRSIWYVRYIDWTITTPLLLLELALASGLPLSQIFFLIFMDVVMIVTGLVGALITSSYKWGFFVFGCLALFAIWFILLGSGRASVARLGSDYSKAYMSSCLMLSGLWLLYPIAWALSDGGNAITPNSEMYFYGVLDVLAKPVYCIIHVLAIQKLDYSRLGWTKGSDGASAGLLSGNNQGANYGSTDARRGN
ncbi:hypothetical protein JCM10212_005637 [Sporobolomyces blumeae]